MGLCRTLVLAVWLSGGGGCGCGGVLCCARVTRCSTGSLTTRMRLSSLALPLLRTRSRRGGPGQNDSVRASASRPTERTPRPAGDWRECRLRILGGWQKEGGNARVAPPLPPPPWAAAAAASGVRCSVQSPHTATRHVKGTCAFIYAHVTDTGCPECPPAAFIVQISARAITGDWHIKGAHGARESCAGSRRVAARGQLRCVCSALQFCTSIRAAGRLGRCLYVGAAS